MISANSEDLLNAASAAPIHAMMRFFEMGRGSCATGAATDRQLWRRMRALIVGYLLSVISATAQTQVDTRQWRPEARLAHGIDPTPNVPEHRLSVPCKLLDV